MNGAERQALAPALWWAWSVAGRPMTPMADALNQVARYQRLAVQLIVAATLGRGVQLTSADTATLGLLLDQDRWRPRDPHRLLGARIQRARLECRGLRLDWPEARHVADALEVRP